MSAHLSHLFAPPPRATTLGSDGYDNPPTGGAGTRACPGLVDPGRRCAPGALHGRSDAPHEPVVRRGPGHDPQPSRRGRPGPGDLPQGLPEVPPVQARHQHQAWLYRILTNTYITSYRKAQRSPKRASTDTVEDWQLADAASHAEVGLKSAEVEALESLPSTQLREALDSLSEEHRMVVLMADVEGMSYKEIAEELGVPMGTVMSRLNRARKNLRSALADVAAEYGIGGTK